MRSVRNGERRNGIILKVRTEEIILLWFVFMSGRGNFVINNNQKGLFRRPVQRPPKRVLLKRRFEIPPKTTSF